MGKVISVVSQKGGVGKTTITALLASVLFFHYRFKVAIIDADYAQFCLFKRREDELELVKKSEKLHAAYQLLYKDRDPYPIFRFRLHHCAEQLEKLKPHFDYIFLDFAGSMNQTGILDTYRLINHFLIPILKDKYSLKSAIEFYEVINSAVRTHPNFESCHLFFNNIPLRNQANINKVLPFLIKKYPVLPVYLRNFQVYENAYQNTLFPFPKNKLEGKKFFEFHKMVFDRIETTTPSLTY